MDVRQFLDHVPVGRKNAVKIDYLASKVRMSGRQTREMIEEVNASGEAVIINLSDGRGYFVADETEKNLERLYMAQEARRFASLKKKLEGIEHYLNGERAGQGIPDNHQISIFDLTGREL